MSWVEIRCDGCGAVNSIKIWHANRVDPGFPENDSCSECNRELDFSAAIEVEPPEPDPDRFRA